MEKFSMTEERDELGRKITMRANPEGAWCLVGEMQAKVQSMLELSEADVSAEVLSGNAVKEALSRGEVVALRQVLDFLRS
jgi:hypothetical protein